MDPKHLGSTGINSDKSYRTRHLILLGNILNTLSANTDYEFQMQYLKDANGDLVWVEVNSVDGVKTYTYYDAPGGSTVVPVQPLQPLSLDKDTELIEDQYIVINTNLTNGYSVGDVVSKISYFDITSPTPVLINSFWYNKTTSTILSTVDIFDFEDQDGPMITTPGTDGFKVTVDGTYNFTFDADSISIDNQSVDEITVTIDGVLGGDFFMPKKTQKSISYDVAKATGIIISGITAGTVYIEYNRGK